MLIPSDFDLPSIEEFKNILNELTKLDLAGASVQEIEKAYLSKVPFFPRMLSMMHFEETKHLPFYRVRLNIDQEREDLSLIRTYSYPSSIQCTTNGRANRKGRTVFYCSNKAYAAIVESKPKQGDTGFLSIWKNNISRPLKMAVYLPQEFAISNEFQEVSNDAHNFARNYYERHGKEKLDHFIALNNFVVEQFVKESFPYTLTSYLSNDALYSNDPKEVIIYPSVATNSQFCNFAFHPNIVDRFLSFEKVIGFHVIKKGYGKDMQFGLGQLGEIAHNAIHWRTGTFEEVNINTLP